ncbi:copia protein [Trifolium medium]|uniref:Copia protein n=1 Tax=Trifolium medium TaxID=97028 RepID=A0A392MCJ5_9FABA|nr:copia protein [Trifolium medium]
MNVAANTVFHERTKHLDIDYHIVRLKVYEGLMELLSIPTASQVADIITRASNPHSFHALVTKLGLVDIFHPPACVGACLLLNDNTIIICKFWNPVVFLPR